MISDLHWVMHASHLGLITQMLTLLELLGQPCIAKKQHCFFTNYQKAVDEETLVYECDLHIGIGTATVTM